jgi:hypothetical protein
MNLTVFVNQYISRHLPELAVNRALNETLGALRPENKAFENQL